MLVSVQAIPRMARGRGVSRVLATGPACLRRYQGHPVGLVGDGRRDDQGPPGGGKKPGPIRPIAPRTEPNAASSPMARACPWGSRLTARTAMTTSSWRRPSRASRCPGLARPGPPPRAFAWTRGTTTRSPGPLRKHSGFTLHLRSRGEEKKELKRQPGVKARRWVVERTHGWMNRFRRILVRWEIREDTYVAMLHFVCGIRVARFGPIEIGSKDVCRQTGRPGWTCCRDRRQGDHHRP